MYLFYRVTELVVTPVLAGVRHYLKAEMVSGHDVSGRALGLSARSPELVGRYALHERRGPLPWTVGCEDQHAQAYTAALEITVGSNHQH